MKTRRKFTLTAAQAVMLSFFLLITTGTVLLALPISSATGKAVSVLDALFTATSASCVTGLVTLPSYSAWSVFGQIVILALIQIGGLGVITTLAGIVISMNKRLGVRDRVMLADALNLSSMDGVVRFTRRAIHGTLAVEAAGALMYMTVFVPRYGLKGIWVSVFTAISAFCNAGIDIIGSDSLCEYVHNPIINGVTEAMIILGGIGYIVWWDVLRVIREARVKGLRCLCRLTLHSKIALISTAVLIAAGALGIFIFEFSNPLTMAEYSLPQRLGASLFQSVTTRTAGFATIPQQNLTNPSAVLSLLLMFIGGSPAGTAGGVKTVTMAVLMASMLASVLNKSEVTLFDRTISRATVSRAAAVVSMSFIINFVSILLLSMVADASIADVMYESVSAAATVGLTRGLTPALNFAGKLIITATMYLGRIGPISLALAFATRKTAPDLIKSPTADISVG
ncbi:MAG: potassium transporter KtrB [Clostridiales bacterium]|nr:potassium transporter KtrB [Clostridiales bacterium]